MSFHRFPIDGVLAPVLSVLGVVSAIAQPTLSIPTTVASVGESVISSVLLESQQSDISGIQFDVEWDTAAMNLTFVPGTRTRDASKRIYQIDISPGKKRFLIFGLNQTLIQSGALADLFSNLQDEVSTETHSLKVTNIIATNQSGDVINAIGIDGAITIQENGIKGLKLKPGGVRNGGSLLPGAVSPGEVITIFGSGIGSAIEQFSNSSSTNLSLGSTSLLFDGIAAPLFYADIDQINAIVPLSVLNKASTQVQVLRDGEVLAEILVPVTATAPAIFTQSADGLGSATALNENMTLSTVDNPAERSKTITFFATGVDQMGSLSVAMGGIDAEVLSAGPAPFSVAGVSQVICRVPSDLRTGPTVPIILSVGTERSQAGVSISLQ